MQASGIQNGSFQNFKGSAAMGTGSAGGQRYSGAGSNVCDSNGDGSAPIKRPRVEACAKASPAEVEAYRKKHEITVMVSFGT